MENQSRIKSSRLVLLVFVCMTVAACIDEAPEPIPEPFALETTPSAIEVPMGNESSASVTLVSSMFTESIYITRTMVDLSFYSSDPSTVTVGDLVPEESNFRGYPTGPRTHPEDDPNLICSNGACYTRSLEAGSIAIDQGRLIVDCLRIGTADIEVQGVLTTVEEHPGEMLISGPIVESVNATTTFSVACVTNPECGDGEPDEGEQCDDGNTVPDDGCDEFCRLEESICDEMWPEMAAWLDDEVGDYVDSSSTNELAIEDPAVDIVRVGAQVVSMTECEADHVFGSLVSCGNTTEVGQTVCGGNLSSMTEGEVLIVEQQLNADVPLANDEYFYIYSLVLETNDDEEDNWPASHPSDWDFFNGTDRWYQLIFDVPAQFWYTTTTHLDTDLWPHREEPTTARAVINGDTITWFVHMDDFESDNPGFRVTAFKHDGRFSMDNRVGDVNGANPLDELTPVRGE